MRTSLGHGDLAENVAKSELMDKVKGIIKDAKEHTKIGSQGIVFEEGKKLTAEDLKTPQDPEEFTKSYIVEKVLDLLNVNYQTGERRFKDTGGFRKVDYGPSYKTTNFLVEAKPIKGDLDSKSKDSAVNQLKGIFRLHEAKVNYSFGIATDGLRWIFISNDGEQVADCNILDDFGAIEHFITGKERVRTLKKEAEISKRFYQWYNALLHGGSYRDLKGKQRKILKESCLVESVLNVLQEEDREEIAQVFINRLIFIKFLQAKGIIKEDVLEHLTSLTQDILDLKLRQLFFGILNTEADKRVDPDPNFIDIPYLNGSLFIRSKPEEKNPDSRIKADVLQEVIRFLDTFRFVSETETAEENIDPEVLGYIFERTMTATDRKGTGAYYTPKYITHYICENTIHPYILDRTRDYLKKEKGYKEKELPNDFSDILNLRSLTLRDVYSKVVQKITVCDPACGSGAFLLAAADILLDIYAKIEDSLGREGRNPDVALKKVILKDNIFGVDINHRGIEIAKLRLWLWMAESYDPDGRVEALPNLEYNIRAGNSLVGYVDVGKFKEARVSMDDYLELETPVMDLVEKRDELLKEYKFASGEKARELRKQIEEVGTKIKQRLDIHLFQDMKAKKIDISSTDFAKLEPFHWGYEFHKVFENGEGGFSVVIGNPPYGLKLSKPEKKIFDLNYPIIKAIYESYLAFILEGLNITKNEGFISYIVPDSWHNLKFAKEFRKKIIDGYQITRLTKISSSVFSDAMVDTSIFFFQNLEPNFEATIENFNVESSVLNKILDYSINQKHWLKNRDFRIDVHIPPHLRTLIEKIERVSTPINDILETTRGINAYDKYRGQPEEIIKSRAYHSNYKKDGTFVPELMGEDVSRYSIFWQDNHWISYGPWLAAPREERFFSQPKLLVRKILSTGRIVGVVDKEGFYVDQQLYIGISPKEYNLFYILTNVCSKLLSKYFIIKYAESTELFPHLQVNYFKNLPIRRISFTVTEDERTELVSELKGLYDESNFPEILSRIESHLPKDTGGNFITEEEKSDVIHDFLAFLAEQMIELNKEKQAEIKGFLAWLEGYLEIKVDEMNVKTKVRDFYNENVTWDEYYKVLKKSKEKTEANIEGKDAHDTIKEAFDSSKASLAPLMERIKETDDLIDQIVYKLYGLTGEEIDIVEGG